MATREKHKLRAVIYARTSNDDGDLARKNKGKKMTNDSRKESIEAQIEECKARCERQGYEVVGIYWDQNVSGRTYPLYYSINYPALDKYFDEHIKRPSKRFGKSTYGSSLSRPEGLHYEFNNVLTLVIG